MTIHTDLTAAHAVYAPSSAHRWIECTASAEAIATLPEEEEGEEAARGTAAHEEIERRLAPLARDLKAEPRPADVEHPSAYGVALMVDYVRKLIGSPTVDDRLWIEQRVALTDQIWGRCDVSHWHAESRTLTIADYKDGFVGVDPDAEQVRIYGAASMFTHNLPVKWIRYAVIQPNDFRPVPRVKQHVESVDSLYAWAEVVSNIPHRPKKFKAGEHCTYCPLFGRCDASRDILAQVSALVAGLMRAEEVAPEQRALFMACQKPIKDAFTKAEKIWLKEALAKDVPPPGLEIVLAQKHKAWKDEKAARALVVERLGVDALDLPTPAQAIERGIPEDIVNPMAPRPDGAPTLAFANDKRPKYRRKTVEQMFGGLNLAARCS